jgi:hypothetical protein
LKPGVEEKISMEKLLVKYFGPLTEAELIIKDINIFIGTTSSGKSTVAKLLAIFKGAALRNSLDYARFVQLLMDYNIDFAVTNSSFLRYENKAYYIEVSGQSLHTNYPTDSIGDAYNPIYIPAERMFFPTFSQSIFSLINNNIGLPKWLIDFGAKFEQARRQLTSYSVGFLGVDYEYDNQTDYIRISDQVKIKLSQASSGLQSVVPLVLVVQYYTLVKGEFENLFVIEEPELNLYPSAQKDLVDYLVGRIYKTKDALVVTTHSPYLLTAIDNLIQANNAVEENSAARKAVEQLVPASRWIDFDHVSCYYFKGGNCRSTLDSEMKSIGPSNIDDVSSAISDTFEELLALKYPA